MIGIVNGDMGGVYHHESTQQQQQYLQQQQQHPSSHHAQHSSLGHGHPSHSQLQHLHHNFHQHGGAVAGPSSRIHAVSSMEDIRKEKKRKEISGKVGKEMGDRRDELSIVFDQSPLSCLTHI